MGKFATLLDRIQSAAHYLRSGRLPEVARQTIPAISPAEVKEARTFFPLDKFFIFGFARSGTTLLMRLVDAHPDILCMRQAHFFTRPPFLETMVADRAFEEWLSRPSFRWNRGHDLSPVMLRAAADFVLEREARRKKAKFVGDKSPNNLTNGAAVARLERVYPDARLLFLVRDGRDAILSHLFQLFIDKSAQLSRANLRIKLAFERDPDRFGAQRDSIFTEKWLRESAENWVENVTDTHRSGLELFRDRYRVVRFHQLLAEPVKTLNEVWSFLGAETGNGEHNEALLSIIRENRDRTWQQKKAGSAAAPIPKGARGSWSRYFTARDKRIFNEIAGETLIAWGFERELNG